MIKVEIIQNLRFYVEMLQKIDSLQLKSLILIFICD